MGKADELKLATPRIESIGDRRFLWADNVLLTNISTMLPFEWSNLKRLFDRRSTFEIRSGPFEYERIRIGFDDDLIRWTVFLRLVASEDDDHLHRLRDDHAGPVRTRIRPVAKGQRHHG